MTVSSNVEASMRSSRCRRFRSILLVQDGLKAPKSDVLRIIWNVGYLGSKGLARWDDPFRKWKHIPKNAYISQIPNYLENSKMEIQ